ncbi:MAG: hypothetical protein R3351_07990, partial [Nitrospirales bacterium]|nr:hypothetical protein [Nitrospirales bacterium]
MSQFTSFPMSCSIAPMVAVMAKDLPVLNSDVKADPDMARGQQERQVHHESRSTLSSSHRLSKSRFLAGLQCLKRLYLEIHEPDLAAPPSPDRRAIMDLGTEVGEVARRLFPGGVLVEETHRQIPAALRRTEALLENPATIAIFEGAFIWNGVLIRVDILERVNTDQWRLIEVKATSKVKPIHLDDLAIQMTVLENIPLHIESCVLMHLNTQYAFEGNALNLEELFSRVNMTEEVKRRQASLQPQ